MFRNISTLFSTGLCVYCFAATHVTSKILRVFQGKDAVLGEFPYVVALAVKYNEGTKFEFYEPFCSGSIVTPVWTLTAGHCVAMVKSISSDILHSHRPWTRLVIHYTMSTEWITSDIISTQRHPGYKVRSSRQNKLTVTNDIGLLKTNSTTASMLGKISSVDYRTLYGHKVTSAGFGLMNSEKGVDDVLSLNKSLQVYTAAVGKCSHTKDTVHPSFCLSWKCNQPSTSCSGDSGGPVIHPTGIIAVVTAGDNEKCNTMETSNVAAIVTPLSPFVNWIVKKIRE